MDICSKKNFLYFIPLSLSLSLSLSQRCWWLWESSSISCSSAVSCSSTRWSCKAVLVVAPHLPNLFVFLPNLGFVRGFMAMLVLEMLWGVGLGSNCRRERSLIFWSRLCWRWWRWGGGDYRGWVGWFVALVLDLWWCCGVWVVMIGWWLSCVGYRDWVVSVVGGGGGDYDLYLVDVGDFFFFFFWWL